MNSANKLYIFISTNKFIFVSYNSLVATSVKYKTFIFNPRYSANANMHEAVKNIDFTKEEYNSINIILDSPFTTIPLMEFDEENISDIYFYNLPEKKERKKVLYDTLPHMGMILLYAIDKDLHHTLTEYFQEINISCSHTAMLMHCVSLSNINNENITLIAYLNGQEMLLSLIKKHSILQTNIFQLHNAEDAEYYILNWYNLFQFDTKEETIILIGDDAQRIKQKLTQYVANVQIASQSEELNNHPLTSCSELPYEMVVAMLHAY